MSSWTEEETYNKRFFKITTHFYLPEVKEVPGLEKRFFSKYLNVEGSTERAEFNLYRWEGDEWKFVNAYPNPYAVLSALKSKCAKYVEFEGLEEPPVDSTPIGVRDLEQPEWWKHAGRSYQVSKKGLAMDRLRDNPRDREKPLGYTAEMHEEVVRMEMEIRDLKKSLKDAESKISGAQSVFNIMVVIIAVLLGWILVEWVL